MMDAPAELLETFVLDAWDALGAFGDAVGRLGESYGPEALHDLGVVAHRIKGSAALYGYPQLSKLAELVDALVERLRTTQEPASAEQKATFVLFLEQVAACLQGGVERIGGSGSEGELGLDLAHLGGTSLLLELLREHPKSFVRPLHKKKEEARAARGLQEELQGFVRANGDVWEFFAPEAQEHIEVLHAALDALGEPQGPQGHEAQLTALFRATHTLKGAAYSVGLESVGELSHRLEDLMVAAREGELPFGDTAKEALRRGAEALTLMLLCAEGRPVAVERVVEEVRALVAGLLGEGGEEGAADAVGSSLHPDLHPDTAFGTAPDAPASHASTSRARAAALVADLRRDRDDDPETWAAFAPAAAEHTVAIHEALRGLTAGSYDEGDEESEALQDFDALSRAVHGLEVYTLEALDLGAACGAGYAPLVRLVRHTVALCAAAREGDIPLSEAVGALGRANDALGSIVRAEEGAEEALAEVLPGLGAPEVGSETGPETEPEAAGTHSGTPSRPRATIRVSLDRLDALMNLAGDMVTARARLERQLEKFGEMNALLETSRARMLRTVSEFEEKYLNPRLARAEPWTTQAAAETLAVTTGTGEAGGNAPERAFGVSASEMFGELELDSYSDLNILSRSVAEMADDLSEIQERLNALNGGFFEEAERVKKLVRSLRTEVGRARLVPVSGLFGRLKRLVPGGAYRLVTSGETTEIDNAVLERVGDAMLHLVKNALAHAFEPEGVRMAAGKDALGTLSLRAYHRGNHVFLEVEDDGAGVDVAAVKRKAVDKGFRTPEEVDVLTATEATALIFIPGLSTSEAVTTDAGRGVGMDVVAEEVRRLKGEIGVESTPGRGTRFTLKLPLTLLISEALTVGVGAQAFAFPVNAVRALRTLPHADMTGGVGSEGGETVPFEGERLPLYHLAELLGVPGAAAPDTLSFVVAETSGGRAAFSVDAFGEIEEVVIRSVGDLLHGLPHLAGAAISSSGEVVLVLDPSGLTLLAGGAGPRAASVVTERVHARAKRLLLADDSVSVRRVVGKMLTKAGFEVVLANDGQDALEKLPEGPFDAVLTDLEMPRVNGFELIEELRRRPDTMNTPVVVMTTRAGDKHMRLALASGATHYFAKPVDESRLLRALQEF